MYLSFNTIVCTGLLITFIFLCVTTASKPYCTEGLSNLNSLTMVAQFITLYGGLVLIVEDYIQQQLIAANQADSTGPQSIIIYILIYFCNGAVMAFPVIQKLLQKSPARYAEDILHTIKKHLSPNKHHEVEVLDNEEEKHSETSHPEEQGKTSVAQEATLIAAGNLNPEGEAHPSFFQHVENILNIIKKNFSENPGQKEAKQDQTKGEAGWANLCWPEDGQREGAQTNLSSHYPSVGAATLPLDSEEIAGMEEKKCEEDETPGHVAPQQVSMPEGLDKGLEEAAGVLGLFSELCTARQH